MIRVFTLLIALAFTGCTCSDTCDYQLSDDFLTDLGSENNRIEGDLYLDIFNGDLSTLTYDYYLSYIAANEAPSAKGFTKIVKAADRQYFKAAKDYYVLVLYYKRENKVIGDNSNTAFVDTVRTLAPGESAINLARFAHTAESE